MGFVAAPFRGAVPATGRGGGGHLAAKLHGQFPCPREEAQKVTEASGMVIASGPAVVFPPEALGYALFVYNSACLVFAY